MTIHFLIPGDINTLTGGYVYDKNIIEGLIKSGYTVNVHQLSNDFPFPSEENLKKCEAIYKSIPNGNPVFIDSLAFGPIHNILLMYQNKNPVIAIIHLPLTKNPNFSRAEREQFFLPEQNALKLANKIVAVSEFTKQIIIDYGIETSKIEVITPGVFKMPKKQSYPDNPEKILCVGSYLPGKGQLLLVRALAKLKHLCWTLNMFGIQNFDLPYVQKIQTEIIAEHLDERIFINPPISGDKLTKAYLNADLFILPSFFENFSMALNDALNYGIPVITTDGGGIPLSVPKNMGIIIPKGNETDLKQTIENVLTDSLLYKNLCNAASDYYKSANTWENSINLFQSLLKNINSNCSV